MNSKTFKYSFLALAFLFSIVSANASEIAITVKNTAEKKAVLLFTNYATFTTDTLVRFDLGKAGVNKKEIAIPQNGFYSLYIGKLVVPVFLEKGNNYHISMDYSVYPAAFKVNNREEFYELLYNFNNDWMYAKDSDDLNTQLENIAAFRDVHLQKINSAKLLSQKEKELLGLMLDGIIAIMKNNFAAVTQDKKNEGLVGYLKDFKIVNNNIYQVFPEKFLKSMLYNSFIVNYGSSPGIKPKEYLDYIKEVVPNRVMSDYFSAQFFANSIRNIEKKEADSIFAFLKASVYSDQILQNVYVKVNKTYKSNFPLPVLELLTKNKNVISTTSFRGKLLLIDVWALWCGPCMAAKPYLDSLEIFYKNAPELKVLRVSIDQDKNQWLKAVTKEKLNDYWVEGGFKSEFCEALNVTSIPRFIVVNELGIVIDPNAPGPKDKALFTLIDKELVRIRSKGK